MRYYNDTAVCIPIIYFFNDGRRFLFVSTCIVLGMICGTSASAAVKYRSLGPRRPPGATGPERRIDPYRARRAEPMVYTAWPVQT